MKTDRVLPFRFLAAARNAPQWEESSGEGDVRVARGSRQRKLAGHTVLLVDVSGSMAAPLSRAFRDAAHRRRLRAGDPAARDRGEGDVYTFSDARSACRRGADSRCATRIDASQPHSGTYLGGALGRRPRAVRPPDRDHRRAVARLVCRNAAASGYMINVASYKNGVGYGEWTHIDGWSEAVVDYIRALESDEPAPSDLIRGWGRTWVPGRDFFSVGLQRCSYSQRAQHDEIRLRVSDHRCPAQ